MEQKGEWYRFASPAIPKAPVPQKLVGFVQRLAQLEPDDLCRGITPKLVGLDPPESGVAIEYPGGEVVDIRVGKKTARGDQRYVMISGSKHVFALDDGKIKTILPPLKDLVDYRPVRADRDSVQGFELLLDKMPVNLIRGQDWEARVGGTPFMAKQGGVDKLLDFIDGLQVEDVNTKPPATTVEQTLQVMLDDGSTATIEASRPNPDGAPEDLKETRFIRIGSAGPHFVIPKTDYDKALVKFADVVDPILFKKKDLIESAAIKTEQEEKALELGKLQPLFGEKVMPSAENTGLDASKLSLIVKTKDKKEHVVVFGDAVKDQAHLRYAQYKGSSVVWLVQDAVLQQMMK
jgi:hypothetical protein